MKTSLLLIICMIMSHCSGSKGELGIFEDNPRYFSWDGKPVFLASRSFGWTAISDPQFDYIHDIETMAANGGNLLRLTLFWPGHGDEGGELPWVRDEQTGLYDLDEFNPAYFGKLRHYIAVARKNKAVVNLELFDHPAVKGGSGRWPSHPMNPARNVNYDDEEFSTSSVDHRFFRTLPMHDNKPAALQYQQRLLYKILDETLVFGNVIYSLGNECPSPVEWNLYWAHLIKDYAAGRGSGKIMVTNMWQRDMVEFDVFDIQDAQNPYRVRRANAGQMWSAYQAIHSWQRDQNNVKPVYDSGQMGGAPGSHILHQLWMSFVGGTAGMRYHRMAPVHPRPGISSEVEVGNWEDPFHLEQMKWISNFRKFTADIQFWTMDPLWDLVIMGEGYAFGRPGNEYIIYLPSGERITISGFESTGNYELRWYDPDQGIYKETENLRIREDDGQVTFTPPGQAHWVLHIIRKGGLI